MLKKIKLDKKGRIAHSAEFLQLCADSKGDVAEVKAEEVAQRLATDSCLLIDVRDQDELLAQGGIDGACHISKGWLEALIHHVCVDKEMEIILYCGSGNRSLLAAASLKKMGYLNVKSMQGGYKGWVAADYPVASVV